MTSWIWDASALHHAAASGSLAELQALSRWLDVVSRGPRSRGEATVFAWAEVNDAVVIVDDDARRAARGHGLTAHGTLWILVEAIKEGALRPAGADAIVHTLRSSGARLPALGGQEPAPLSWAADPA